MGVVGAFSILLMTAELAVAQGIELNVRLAEGKFFESGLVQIWREGVWGNYSNCNRSTS